MTLLFAILTINMRTYVGGCVRAGEYNLILIFASYYSGTCVNGHLRRAVTLHKAVSTESPNGIFHALHTH